MDRYDVGTGGGGTGGTPFIPMEEVTYNQLYNYIIGYQLIPGKKYLISDYITTYNQDITGEFLSGNDYEPLIVTASKNNGLEPIAYSLIYPNDIIYYNYDNTMTDSYGNNQYIAGATTGVIYRRIDTLLNNDVCFDFRNIKFRRYKLNIPNYDNYTTYNKYDVVYEPNTNAYYKYADYNPTAGEFDGQK
jgi:hypothetical protein